MAVLKLVVGVGLISHYLCRYYKNSGWDAEERCQSDMFPFFYVSYRMREFLERTEQRRLGCGMSPFPGFIMTLTVSDRFLASFSPSTSFGGRHEPKASKDLIIPRGCGGSRGWGKGPARAQRREREGVELCGVNDGVTLEIPQP